MVSGYQTIVPFSDHLNIPSTWDGDGYRLGVLLGERDKNLIESWTRLAFNQTVEDLRSEYARMDSEIVSLK